VEEEEDQNEDCDIIWNIVNTNARRAMILSRERRPLQRLGKV